MTCENEAVSRALTRAKAMQIDWNENVGVAKDGIGSIREQLDQMSTILKGANFKNNNGYKKHDKQDIRNKLKARVLRQQDLSGRVKSQYSVIDVMVGGITKYEVT